MPSGTSQLGIACRIDGESQVEPPIEQPLLQLGARSHYEFELQPWIAPFQLPHERRETSLRKRLCRTYAKDADVQTFSAHRLANASVFLDHGGDARGKRLATAGHRKTAPCSFEQSSADFAFELIDPQRDGRRRDV
jgi:hypothetical protein